VFREGFDHDTVIIDRKAESSLSLQRSVILAIALFVIPIEAFSGMKSRFSYQLSAIGYQVSSIFKT
jgi:hypothetical protein